MKSHVCLDAPITCWAQVSLDPEESPEHALEVTAADVGFEKYVTAAERARAAEEEARRVAEAAKQKDNAQVRAGMRVCVEKGCSVRSRGSYCPMCMRGRGRVCVRCVCGGGVLVVCAWRVCSCIGAYCATLLRLCSYCATPLCDVSVGALDCVMCQLRALM